MKFGLNKMISLAIVISFLANTATERADALMTFFFKGYHAAVIAGHAVNSASLGGGMAFLIVLGLGYGAKKFIDPLLKHKEKQKNAKADKLLNSHS